MAIDGFGIMIVWLLWGLVILVAALLLYRVVRRGKHGAGSSRTTDATRTDPD